MAFGFSKGETVQGDIKGADDANRDTKIDFEEDQIKLVTGGADTFQVSGSTVVSKAMVITGSEVPNTFATTTSTALVTYGSIEIKTTGNTEALRITKENNSDVREIVFENAGTDAQEIYTTGDALVIRNGINNEDIVFRLKSNGSNTNMFRLDASAKNISINNPPVILDQCITNNGGYAGRVTSVTSTYTVADGDWLLACSGDSTKTINLPAASSNTGRVLHIKDIDGNANSYNITLDGNGSETIDGSTTYTITQNRASVTIVCTGVTWAIVSMYSGPPPGGP
tara:strand:+ start:14265 stop:15113 length:849 start_codon:yes stop_codon:yes gene_type:complete